MKEKPQRQLPRPVTGVGRTCSSWAKLANSMLNWATRRAPSKTHLIAVPAMSTLFTDVEPASQGFFSLENYRQTKRVLEKS